jgi:hypothetical protein
MIVPYSGIHAIILRLWGQDFIAIPVNLILVFHEKKRKIAHWFGNLI